MAGMSIGAKVNVRIGERLIPGVILSHHFASTRMYDLYMLRIAEYDQQRQRWQGLRYGPVPFYKLTMRETHVPVLSSS